MSRSAFPFTKHAAGPGDAYVSGTLFSATNYPLIAYIRFAFGRSQGEMLQAPSWVYDECFDIRGRATGDPTKEALTVSTPGKLGPQIAPHQQDQPCGQDPKFAAIPRGSAGLVAASNPA